MTKDMLQRNNPAGSKSCPSAVKKIPPYGGINLLKVLDAN